MTDLIDQYRQMHEAGNFAGLTILNYLPAIKALVEETGARDAIDFGCGKGDAWFKHDMADFFGFATVFCFDPAVPEFDQRPKWSYEAVLCVDVLEHLEEPDVEPTVQYLFDLAEKFVFLTVCTRPAKKTLPDGRNCHLTIKPEEWWRELVARVAGEKRYELRFTE